MKKLQNHLIGVDQGEELLFSDFEEDGPMWAETGPRRARTEVQFSAAFSDVPAVHVGLAMLDLDQETNTRLDLRAEEVTRTGFAIVLRTWGDSRIARLRANWMAIGALRHDDDWDI